MANKARGEVGIDVDGKQYTLRPTFDAFCELESLVNQPFDEIMTSVQQGRLSGLRSVVWCVLQDQHADEIKTLKDASAWIERVGGTPVALDAINRVFLANLEEAPADGSAPNPPDAQAGTGEPSPSALPATV